MNRRFQQTGTVLVVSLLIVAVMTAVAVNVASRFQLSMARAEQRFYGGQLQQYWLSIESFALWGLRQDQEQDQQNHGNKPYDHHREAWSTIKVEAPLDGGFASGALEDAQGRFNLNSLLGRPQKYNANGHFEERFTANQRRFIRLLQTYDDGVLDVAAASQITQALMDWIDADNDVNGIGGAENDYYLGLDIPYRAANQPLVSVSELRLIKGVTSALFDYLADLVVALPDSNAGINVNTAKRAILRTLTAAAVETPLDESDAQILEASRPPAPDAQQAATEAEDNTVTEGFDDLQAFFQSSAAATVFGADASVWPSAEGLTTGSHYFLLSAEAQIDETRRRGYSLLKRDLNNGQPRTVVIRRATTEYF
ncbi:MAG: type II secretion system minor pseudopilin GspK [Cellvibrionaceae bacterium]|nr:type II secretion system minor pseudopilin GspK [Cellvibrionaceae bacterium]